MNIQTYRILVNDIAKWLAGNTEPSRQIEDLLKRLWDSIELLYPKGDWHEKEDPS